MVLAPDWNYCLLKKIIVMQKPTGTNQKMNATSEISCSLMLAAQLCQHMSLEIFAKPAKKRLARGERLCLKPQSFSSLLKILFTGICPVDFRTAEFGYSCQLLVLNPEKCRKIKAIKSQMYQYIRKPYVIGQKIDQKSLFLLSWNQKN